jgi:CheY-like chemotaxis protein
LRILVVDDDRDTAESLAVLLRLAGHEPEIAFSGKDALTLATRGGFSVAIIDIAMPGMNGYELAEQLKKLIRPPFIIAVTGYGREEDCRRCREAGMDLHLLKPVDPNSLAILLARLQQIIGDG